MDTAAATLQERFGPDSDTEDEMNLLERVKFQVKEV